MSLPFAERVAMLSINPDAATRDDVARMAAELMEANQNLMALRAQSKAAPQPSTADDSSAPSVEGVGQGEVASAAPDNKEGMPIVDIEAGRNVAWLQQFALEPSLSEVERDSLIVAAGVLAARAQRVYALALALREKREDIVNAAVELESYLAKINTQERQSIIFQVPDDDMDGVALAGFCERLTQLSKAIRALKSAAPSAGEGEKT